MRRVTHERYISQSQRANCDLARRYVGLNLSQHADVEVTTLYVLELVMVFRIVGDVDGRLAVEVKFAGCGWLDIVIREFFV